MVKGETPLHSVHDDWTGPHDGRRQDAPPLTGQALLQSRLRIGARAAALLVVSALLAILPTGVAVILASYAFWFVLASLPFVVRDASWAPVFAAGDKGSSSKGPEAAVLDWCLDRDAGELYPCRIDEFFEQEEDFSDEDHELYWELYEQLP